MSADIFEKNNIRLPTIEEVEEIDNPPVVAHFTNGLWDWYVIAGEKLDDDYRLLGLVNGDYKEMGTFTLKQLENVSAKLISIENISLQEVKSRI
ncbi:hypothetical protein [Methanobrevibacter sp.]|uniref:hypothetical protein n=1 Tax=Methanobrevibacter sp. TaxID=66852 RepID=UPI003D7D41F9